MQPGVVVAQTACKRQAVQPGTVAVCGWLSLRATCMPRHPHFTSSSISFHARHGCMVCPLLVCPQDLTEASPEEIEKTFRHVARIQHEGLSLLWPSPCPVAHTRQCNPADLDSNSSCCRPALLTHSLLDSMTRRTNVFGYIFMTQAGSPGLSCPAG